MPTRIVVLGCVLISAGCGANRVNPESFIAPTGTTIRASVLLVLPKAYREATWTHEMVGPDQDWMIGDALSDYAKATASSVFSSVRVQAEGGSSVDSDAAYTLTPTLLSIDSGADAMAFADIVTTVRFEWTLSRRDGSLIWKDTIVTQSVHKTVKIGLASISRDDRVLDEALRDSFLESYKRLTSSRECQAIGGS